MADSPRVEVSPRSIDDLFAADPNDLTEADFRQIISEFRAKRDIWEKAEHEKQTGGKKPKAVAGPTVKLDETDLADIMNSIIKEA